MGFVPMRPKYGWLPVPPAGQPRRPFKPRPKPVPFRSYSEMFDDYGDEPWWFKLLMRLVVICGIAFWPGLFYLLYLWLR